MSTECWGSTFPNYRFRTEMRLVKLKRSSNACDNVISSKIIMKWLTRCVFFPCHCRCTLSNSFDLHELELTDDYSMQSSISTFLFERLMSSSLLAAFIFSFVCSIILRLKRTTPNNEFGFIRFFAIYGIFSADECSAWYIYYARYPRTVWVLSQFFIVSHKYSVFVVLHSHISMRRIRTLNSWRN